ncbi:hypothetical protein ACFL1I_04540 [Candidatus Omnitrophota bacterium]
MKKILLNLTILLLVSNLASAGGLTTTFGEVKVENLQIGNEYSLEQAVEFPLIVQNTSDQQIELKVDVLYPREKELKTGFTPIPDIDWISLEQDYFVLAPGEEAKTDVIVAIPEETKYSGARFQVYIWSHTVGQALGVGLKSRLLFTIAEQE